MWTREQFHVYPALKPDTTETAGPYKKLPKETLMYNRDLETSSDVKAEYNRQQKESAAKRLATVAEKKRLKKLIKGK